MQETQGILTSNASPKGEIIRPIFSEGRENGKLSVNSRKAENNAAKAASQSGNGLQDNTTANLFLLMSIIIGLMNVNNEEEIVGAKQTEGESNILTQVGKALQNLNPELSDSSHFGTASLLTSVFTAGLIYLFKSPSDLENMVGDSGPSQSGLVSIQNQQQQYGYIGQAANQAMQTDMELHVTQTSQYTASLGSQWSQMLQVWQQEASTSNSRI